MDDISRLFTKGVNQRFAHEIAHQYWGHVVKMPSYEEQWLTESFAEYCSALALRQMRNKGQGAYDALVSTWKSDASSATSAAPIPLANRIWADKDPRARYLFRTGLIYSKGAYLLYKLHKELGDKNFLIFLRSYQLNFKWKFGTTRDVNGLINFITKKDYTPFFDSYYWGTGLPKD